MSKLTEAAAYFLGASASTAVLVPTGKIFFDSNSSVAPLKFQWLPHATNLPT